MGIVRSVKNLTGGYTSSQVKVRDATANDDSRPPRHVLQEIADLTYDDHEVMLIMDMIDKRLNDKGKYWRHVFKSLILLDYLVHVGSNRVVVWCRENLYIVKTLREFSYRDDSGHEVGDQIRERAKAITSLVMDQERLERERERFARGDRRRPKRYRSRSSPSGSEPRLPRRPGNDEDDELQKALELSRQTAAEEEERRRMAGSIDNSMQEAQQLSAQNQQEMMNQYFYDPYAEQQQAMALFQQQQQQEAALAQAQQDFLNAQQQAQQEAQILYNMQQQQAQAEAQQRAAQEAYQRQVMQQDAAVQPLQTGSNNPFAAFNQASQRSTPAATTPAATPSNNASSSSQLQQTPTGSRQKLHRQSTFDKDHMDRLDQILNLNAPMDTFGNTGSAMVPAQHTQGEFVDSSGRGLTAMLTARKTGQEGNSNNPFSSQKHYTGIAATQMQPAHTGFGFGNANSSSSNLIDL